MSKEPLNRGFMYERTQWNDLEAAFARRWEQENEDRPGVSGGMLQMLFMKPSRNNLLFELPERMITPTDRYVVATVVQWLGSNVGLSFLNECLRECGMTIVTIKDRKNIEPEKPKRVPSRKFEFS